VQTLAHHVLGDGAQLTGKVEDHVVMLAQIQLVEGKTDTPRRRQKQQ
jgi:hypothetical protein